MAELTRLTYVGHATVLIEMDGQRVLTDPLVTRWLGPLRRQGAAVNPGWLRDIDAVLLSHIHHDHLHAPSLAKLARETRLIVPVGVGTMLRARGFQRVEEVRPGDHVEVGPIVVDVVRAEHDHARHLSSVTAEPQGFVLRGSQQVYFAGDTDIYSEMSALAATLDLALVPIWGWGPTLGSGHLDPARAAEAVELLHPRIVVPIHWGTYFPAGLPWRRAVLRDTPHEFSRRVSEIAPGVKVRTLMPGQEIIIPPRNDN